MDLEGLPPAAYAARARQLTDRQLPKALRDARQKLAHHGRRSWMGQEARKEIEAVTAEMRDRGVDVPAEGE